MSILLKGIKMPRNCHECPAFDHYNYYCNAYSNYHAERYDYDSLSIPEWCGLVGLPEKHGRLVEFVDVATTTDEDTGTETVNLGEAFAAYFKMRESKPVIEAEGEG